MDLDVGRILDRLEALGLRDNTIVIFASHNGYPCGHQGFWGHGNGSNPRTTSDDLSTVAVIATTTGVVSEALIP